MLRSSLLTVSLLLFLSSCGITGPEYVLKSNSLDYSEYERKGFLITESNSVNFNYNAVGSVSALNISGYAMTDKPGKYSKDDAYGSQMAGKKKGSYVKASEIAVLNEMYKKAIELGANAIINLKIVYIPSTVVNAGFGGYQGTGMAIKK